MDKSDSNYGMTKLLRLNEPPVIADDIDGEIVIMNLERGSYYGLDAMGADIWRMIIAGKTGLHISSRLAAHFDVGIDRVQVDISALIEKAREHDLLVLAEEPSPDDASSAEAISAPQYSTPDLAIYKDMKDLLAFDPPLPAYEPVSDK
jgi:hypothetical protein